ncbi:hypothetical protein DFQ01_13847 [Paenibacillus cellulosilyticus]|uniref:Uncharacterized protein n=1 Tax=Paenibacillus cellulosilyticus TaxID=375489 RepID=A0A2V2YGI1_9BACL|nr:hypothetical protein DFQ01_13847 [Paenibacillus cellulosilyticus]
MCSPFVLREVIRLAIIKTLAALASLSVYVYAGTWSHHRIITYSFKYYSPANPKSSRQLEFNCIIDQIRRRRVNPLEKDRKKPAAYATGYQKYILKKGVEF